MKTWMHHITKAAIAALVLMGTLFVQPAQGQGLNNLWMGGYLFSGPPPPEWSGLDGGVDMHFSSETLEISTTDRLLSYFRTNANMTSASGGLLLSSNGASVGNAMGNTMLNGSGLNPSWYTSQYPGGIHIPQANLILPWPDHAGKYFLIHGTEDDQVTTTAYRLYLTVVDLALDGGLGGVTEKNTVLIEDTLVEGRLAAVKHANGRDWWVLCHKAFSDLYYRLLVSPQGVSVDGMQAIGRVRNHANGQSCFSPDGTKYAYYRGGPSGLELFHFDRCTGLLSDPVFAEVPYIILGGIGMAFSPSGHMVYTTTFGSVYQLDTEASDLQASMVHLADWDSTYSPSPPFATMFDIAQLAPDGKIYISTGNGTFHLHVIHNPDEPGLACNLEQHGVELPRYFMNSLPNHPNYHLGALSGTVCDSLGLSTLTPGPSPKERGGVRAYPNPSDGRFMLGYPAHAGVGWLEVRDLAGRVVLRERIPQWSTIHEVALEGEAAGMYHCSMRWGMETMTTRIVIAEP